ncbi:MAG TPA: hypothetical protein PKE27_20365 [Povalibacter sp.]|uniref:hypothetical protein n=1 Tax=Povalibacter sp. TaxID=1962978 RepID=UPI002C48A719|nr:hypothetical protein [Povalibacter sp.]HMN46942.1 hypothetical protein [Povalibacter sp.]
MDRTVAAKRRVVDIALTSCGNLEFDRTLIDASNAGQDRADSCATFDSLQYDEELPMKLHSLLMIMAAGIAIAGCNKAESPAEVQHDVADARADAQRDVSEAQADARENMADAQKDVADAQADHDSGELADAAGDASETAARGDFKVAVAQAEANHKVATEKCEALSGSAQTDCKERADADLDAAKKQAELRRDGAG